MRRCANPECRRSLEGRSKRTTACDSSCRRKASEHRLTEGTNAGAFWSGLAGIERTRPERVESLRRWWRPRRTFA